MTRCPAQWRRQLVNLAVTVSILVTGVAHAQPATFIDNVLAIPKVTVGETIYSVEFGLLVNGGHYDFPLLAAVVLTDTDTDGASTFDGVTLSVPTINVDGINYTLELDVFSASPVVFRLQSFTEVGLGGQNILLVGNSFFLPYAQRLGELALDAGFLEHRDAVVFRGGDNGTPIGLWNNEDTNAEIKKSLDAGNIDIFGMTGYYNRSNPTSGFSEWIDYALQKNPNIKIFISIPPLDFPADWTQRAEDLGLNNIRELYEFFVNDHIHKTVIDQLREMYPSTVIFSIPTGWATFELEGMYENDLLLDDISLFGSFERAIFRDAKGHQGEVVVITGALIWLNSIYGVHLRTNGFDTGFNTDLHKIAKNIMDLHDPDYKQE